MDPTLLLLVIYIALLGSLLGSFTGITPGIHVNTLALLVLLTSSMLISAVSGALASLKLDMEMAPVLLACFWSRRRSRTASSTSCPRSSSGRRRNRNASPALPGHRLLLAGRGLEAVTVAAEGSLLGALFSLIVCAPLLIVGPAIGLESKMEPYIPGLMLMAAVLLILNERDDRGAEYVLRVCGASLQRHWMSTPPIPVHGQEAKVFGRVAREGLCGRRIECGRASFRLVQHRFIGPGDLLVTGVWLSRRRRWVRPTWALLIFLFSGLAGLAVMDGRSRVGGIFDGLGSSLLLPLLTGLFACHRCSPPPGQGRYPARTWRRSAART